MVIFNTYYKTYDFESFSHITRAGTSVVTNVACLSSRLTGIRRLLKGGSTASRRREAATQANQLL